MAVVRVLALLSLLLVPICVRGDDDADGSSVVILTSENFATVRAKPTFVKFYAPWWEMWEWEREEESVATVKTLAYGDCGSITSTSTLCHSYIDIILIIQVQPLHTSGSNLGRAC